MSEFVIIIFFPQNEILPSSAISKQQQSDMARSATSDTKISKLSVEEHIGSTQK